MNAHNDPNIFWFFGVIYRRRWMIASLLLLGLVVAVIVMIAVPPKYRATTTLLIQPPETDKTSEINVLLAGERLALTYSEIINSRPILEEVINKFNLNIPASKFADDISVQPVRDTQLVRVSVTNRSPEQAEALANSIAEAFVTYIGRLTIDQYSQGLDDAQKNIDAKKQEVDLVQADIDKMNTVKADVETELTRLDLLLSENRDNYRTQQENAQDIQLTVAQLADLSHIVDPAKITTASTLTPPFSAKLSMFFDQEAITGGGGFTNPQSNLISTGAGPMMVREPVLEEAIKKMALNETAESLQSRIWVVSITGTKILEFTVKDDNADQAVLIANTVAEVFIERTLKKMAEPYNARLSDIHKEMDTLNQDMTRLQDEIKEISRSKNQVDLELDSLGKVLEMKNSDLRDLHGKYDELNLEAKRSANSVVVAELASQPDKPVQDRFLYIFLALLVTFFISLGLIFLLEFIEDKVVSQEDVSQLLNLEPTAVIGHIGKDNDELLASAKSSSLIAEDFRKLSAAVQPLINDLPIRRLLVTSPNPGEGKSFITANLGIMLSKAGKNVILVDADFRLPRLHQLFGLEQVEGLAEALHTPIVDRLIKKTESKGLRVIPSGNLPEDPIEVLSAPPLKEVLDRLSEKAELVIIDCPPILTLADASYLSHLVDGVLLVVRSGHTERKAIKKAMSLLEKAGLQYVGVVLNDVYGHQNGYYRSYNTPATGRISSKTVQSRLLNLFDQVRQRFQSVIKSTKK